MFISQILSSPIAMSLIPPIRYNLIIFDQLHTFHTSQSARNAEPTKVAKSLRLDTTRKPSGISWSHGSCCSGWLEFTFESECRFGVHVTGSPQRSRRWLYAVGRWRWGGGRRGWSADATINIGLGAAHPGRARGSALNTDVTRYVIVLRNLCAQKIYQSIYEHAIYIHT